MSKEKSIYIRTFGCQMNVRDSEALEGQFIKHGYVKAEHWDDADVVAVVTCSVRLGAEDRAVSFVRSLGGAKYKDKIICFLGCAARNRGEEIKEVMPHVDIIAGPSEVDSILEMVAQIEKNPKHTIIDLEDRVRDESIYQDTYIIEEGKGQVVISTGCDNWCTYCIVPYVRGKLRHRDPKDIVAEVKRLVKAGVSQITLLGQNVNDYNYPVGTRHALSSNEYNFIDLLKDVSAVEGVEEIDFTSSHPKNQSKELFKVMAELPNVKKHLHMAMQSGSTKILKEMNRGYSKEELLDLIYTYKEITNGTIGTDIIVGFPGETEEDFMETYDVVKKARFNYAFIFMYSPRPHSKAYEMEDDVPLEVKKDRHARLMALQKSISAELKAL